MKIQKDVALALASVAAILVALFAAFVTIPVWFEAVIITLAVVGALMTVKEIVKAKRASYDEEEGVYTYKFQFGAFGFGVAILVAVAAIILLSLMRLFGFALIPLVVLLAILFIIACLKKMRTLKWIVGLLVAILVIVLVSYFASTLVNNDVDLNPGISTEVTAPETEVPETETTIPEIKDDDEDEGRPVIPEETKPEETKPEETKPEGTKPEETKPEETKPEETKPEETKPEETKPEETKPEETKPEETKPEETKPEETKPEETKPEETKPEGTKPEETKPAPVVVKINAPKTMSYAEPITVTLEGCKAENLRYTDEDFYSIVIVSQTEVQITLVGYVNGSGEVDLYPASRNLEIFDFASGECVNIEIIGEIDTAEPEEVEPEIKEEEEETKPPVEDVTKPEEETNPVVPETKPEEVKPTPVNPKINAPETIAYARPITITLEDIEAQNLKFSNKDFLSIVIVSDSEVVVTLIGLVDEDGNPIFIPASGYITVTDSVSGVNVAIEIAEAEDNTFADFEIEDEDEDPVIDTPVEEVVKPEITEEEVTPIEVKIEAPEVMYYAEPVVIKVYGIKVEDLKFSDEDFFSIVILSDDEVEITLVGIVNDAGEVEFAPKDGYLTITDSASGVHVIVEIVA